MRSEAARGRAPVGVDFGTGPQCARRRQNLAFAGKLSDLRHVDRRPRVRLTFTVAAVNIAFAAHTGCSVPFSERGPA